MPSDGVLLEDTLKGGAKKPELAKVLCANSAADVDWLVDRRGALRRGVRELKLIADSLALPVAFFFLSLTACNPTRACESRVACQGKSPHLCQMLRRSGCRVTRACSGRMLLSRWTCCKAIFAWHELDRYWLS